MMSDVAVGIAGGERAGIGDLVVTRQNERCLCLRTGGGWVENGDRWIVTAVQADGGLTMRRADDHSQAQLTPQYVS